MSLYDIAQSVNAEITTPRTKQITNQYKNLVFIETQISHLCSLVNKSDVLNSLRGISNSWKTRNAMATLIYFLTTTIRSPINAFRVL